MKKTNLIKTALATILLCASLTACTSTEDKPYSVPESFTVTEKVTKAAENAYSKYDEAVCHPACVLGTKDSVKGTEYMVLESEGFISYHGNDGFRLRVLCPEGFGSYTLGDKYDVESVLIGNENNPEIFHNVDSYEVTEERKATFDAAGADQLNGLEPIAVIAEKDEDLLYVCHEEDTRYAIVEIDADGTVTTHTSFDINEEN